MLRIGLFCLVLSLVIPAPLFGVLARDPSLPTHGRDRRWQAQIGLAEALIGRAESRHRGDARGAPSLEAVGRAVRGAVDSLFEVERDLPAGSLVRTFEAVLRWEQLGAPAAHAELERLRQLLVGLPRTRLPRAVAALLLERLVEVPPTCRRHWTAAAARLVEGCPGSLSLAALASSHARFEREVRLVWCARVGGDARCPHYLLEWGLEARGLMAQHREVLHAPLRGDRRAAFAARLRARLSEAFDLDDLALHAPRSVGLPGSAAGWLRFPLATAVVRPRPDECPRLGPLSVTLEVHDGVGLLALPVVAPAFTPRQAVLAQPHPLALGGEFAPEARAGTLVTHARGGCWLPAESWACREPWGGAAAAPLGAPRFHIERVGGDLASTIFSARQAFDLRWPEGARLAARLPTAPEGALPLHLQLPGGPDNRPGETVPAGTEMPAPEAEAEEPKKAPAWARIGYVAIIFVGSLVLIVGVVRGRNRAQREDDAAA